MFSPHSYGIRGSRLANRGRVFRGDLIAKRPIPGGPAVYFRKIRKTWDFGFLDFCDTLCGGVQLVGAAFFGVAAGCFREVSTQAESENWGRDWPAGASFSQIRRFLVDRRCRDVNGDFGIFTQKHDALRAYSNDHVFTTAVA